jgi:hypothetical protein
LTACQRCSVVVNVNEMPEALTLAELMDALLHVWPIFDFRVNVWVPAHVVRLKYIHTLP